MNTKRKAGIQNEIKRIRACAKPGCENVKLTLEEILENLQAALNAEDMMFENMSSAQKNSEQGEIMAEGIDMMGDAIDYLADIIGSIDEYEDETRRDNLYEVAEMLEDMLEL